MRVGTAINKLPMLSVGAMVLLLGCVFLEGSTSADDWTQWRGNDRDGTWNEKGVVTELTKANLKTLWRQPIDSGYSGPTVAHGRLFLMDRVEQPKQTETIRCFDSKTGNPIWQFTYDCIYTVNYSAGPRASVTIDDEMAFAFGTMGHLHCLNVGDGSEIWKLDLNSEYAISSKKRMPIWGIACSPIVFEDLLIVQIGAPDGACIVALDKSTGKGVWRALDDRGQYSSPVLVKQNGNDVLVCWTSDSVAGINPKSGQVYWREPLVPTRMPIGVATPVIHDDKIFVTSFYDGSMMLKMNSSEMTVQKLWAARGENERVTKSLHSIIGTPIWIGDHIYGVDSHGELCCLRAEDGSRSNLLRSV